MSYDDMPKDERETILENRLGTLLEAIVGKLSGKTRLVISKGYEGVFHPFITLT